MGVPTEHPRLSWGVVSVVVIVSFFVIYGAVDICARLFARDASAYTLFQETSASASVSLAEPLAPENLRIPALSVDAAVEWVGNNGAGNMAAPKHFDNVAWYMLGQKPGAPGNAVIAGHLNSAIGLPGVFENLGELPLGSNIIIEGEGRTLHYVVREMTVYSVDSAPASEIFTDEGPSRLVVITCDGAWDAGVRSYDKRLVVIADLIGE